MPGGAATLLVADAVAVGDPLAVVIGLVAVVEVALAPTAWVLPATALPQLDTASTAAATHASVMVMRRPATSAPSRAAFVGSW
ncbi:hypothetical protein ASD06_02100 [Angustibacter sp. Root456]|nr:hypothetical protein ASD06_02100 [Angustibacter sp. Root456]